MWLDIFTLSKWWVKVTENCPLFTKKLLGRRTFTKRTNLRRTWKNKSLRDQPGFWQIYAVHSCSHGFSYPRQQAPPVPPLVPQSCSRNVKTVVSGEWMGVPETKGRRGHKGPHVAETQTIGSSGCQQTVQFLSIPKLGDKGEWVNPDDSELGQDGETDDCQLLNGV